jgi:succinyl-diaminopimelate desuccinylase
MKKREGVHMTIHWMEEVEKRKDDLIHDLQRLLQIRSVRNEDTASLDAPLGKEVKEALQFMLDLGEKDGFQTKNVDHLAGHIEFGEGGDLLGILCHVDVVPEGDGWSIDPFKGEIKDGKIFARGAIDDKGPTIAAYYAMKIVKELGLPLEKRVRMIIGTDEESDWRCVKHYFQKEEMPTIGFAPDADFPIIHAEKGICDFDFIQAKEWTDDEGASVQLLSFRSGRRYNMVPDFAEAKLVVQEGSTELIQQFQLYMKDHKLVGKVFIDNGELILQLEGVSAHGMEPNNGRNAGIYLANFLSSFSLDRYGAHYVQWITDYFYEDSRGKKFGISYADDITGDVTLNVGKMEYKKGERGRIGVNMRYPVTFSYEEGMKTIYQKAQEEDFIVEVIDHSPPHHVAKDHELIQTLRHVYEQHTGDRSEPLAIGGATYARSLKSGVAFGALFPGREDVAHQKDEYMFIEDLLKATGIYAHAIYELAGKKS